VSKRTRLWKWRFMTERDRRYSEVAQEREKALAIKETADLAALELAREIQTYKDEKANELREQINSERGLYLTKAEAKPLFDFIASAQGRSSGLLDVRAVLFAAAGIATAVALHFLS
jgi:hypothetical protein